MTFWFRCMPMSSGALEEQVGAAGGDLLAFVQTFGPGWRDLGKVSLHLAENKGDKSGSRPFAFLATFVNRADADGDRSRVAGGG